MAYSFRWSSEEFQLGSVLGMFMSMYSVITHQRTHPHDHIGEQHQRRQTHHRRRAATQERDDVINKANIEIHYIFIWFLIDLWLFVIKNEFILKLNVNLLLVIIIIPSMEPLHTKWSFITNYLTSEYYCV